MGRRFVAAKIALASLAACTQAFAAEPPPMWAWGVATQAPVPIYSTTAPPPIAEPPAPKLDSTRQLSIAGSKFRFTAAQISNRHAPADWYPEDHPPMPGLVAKGREDAKSPVWACAFCHMPNGKGRPENAGLAGLSYEYIVQQLYDFKNDLRESSDKRKVETQLMAGFAKAMKHEDIKAVATYFSSLPMKPSVKVIESASAPKTIARDGAYLPLTGAEAGMEPLGSRIIEVPASPEDFEKRNPRLSYIAYVPIGSLEKGENLVTTGGGKTTPCISCHGDDLRGVNPAPPLAGRSPSYMMRQMYDMQQRKRTGLYGQQMAAVLADLSNDEMLAAAAYVASLQP